MGLVLRVPWSKIGDVISSPATLDALSLSMQCSSMATVLCLLLGLPLATWLASSNGRVQSMVRVLVTLPMVLPPVVAGAALLFAFGRSGFVGRFLGLHFEWALPFTMAGVVLAETYVALPFLVLTVEGGLRSLDRRLGDAAATLGASPWRVYRTITLPLLLPALRAGILVAWARALGEFGATITFAGNLAGETRTLPLAIYVALETDPEAAIVLSLLMIIVSGGILFMLRRRWFPTS